MRFLAKGKNSRSNKTLILEPREKKEAKEIVLSGNSLCLFTPDNPIRILCKAIVGHKYFDPFILLMIIFSTVLLTLENPLDDPNG